MWSANICGELLDREGALVNQVSPGTLAHPPRVPALQLPPFHMARRQDHPEVDPLLLLRNHQVALTQFSLLLVSRNCAHWHGCSAVLNLKGILLRLALIALFEAAGSGRGGV